jgi:hypothetical protein
MIKKFILPVLLSAIWISISEFLRNQFLLKTYWVEHYNNLGLVFPQEPVNGAFWGIWSMCFAVVIFIMINKFTLIQTTLLAWFMGFVMMWLVIWNLSVLPVQILIYAIPLSIFETFVAAWITRKLINLWK